MSEKKEGLETFRGDVPEPAVETVEKARKPSQAKIQKARLKVAEMDYPVNLLDTPAAREFAELMYLDGKLTAGEAKALGAVLSDKKSMTKWVVRDGLLRIDREYREKLNEKFKAVVEKTLSPKLWKVIDVGEAERGHKHDWTIVAENEYKCHDCGAHIKDPEAELEPLEEDSAFKVLSKKITSTLDVSELKERPGRLEELERKAKFLRLQPVTESTLKEMEEVAKRMDWLTTIDFEAGPSYRLEGLERL